MLEDLVVFGRKEGLTFAASNLEHYLGGSGVERKFNADWLRQNLPVIKQTERRVEGHFENWLTGRLIPRKQEEKIDFDNVRNLKEGDSPITVESGWEGRIVLTPTASAVNRLGNRLDSDLFPIDRAKDDLTFGSGKSDVIGNGTIELSRVGGVLRFKGTVAMSWEDLYDFNDEIAGLFNPDTNESIDTSRQAMRLFEERGGAAQFLMSSAWTRIVEGTLKETPAGLVLENVRWADDRTFGRPGGDRSR